MLDIISIATLVIVLITIAIFMMLIIISGNINKSDIEREYELEEQAKYIREYHEKSKDKCSLIKHIKKIIGNLKGRD